jgi:hypothetical protein
LRAFHAGGGDSPEGSARTALASLQRHLTGDWGELDEDDHRENELSLERGWRILSCYRLRNGTRIWIITEADRSVTTFLLPEEY